MTRTTLLLSLLVALSGTAQGGWQVGQVLRPSALDRDSKFFNPEGYYFPTDTLAVQGLRVEFLSLMILDHGFDGHYHADSALYAPKGMLSLIRNGEDEGTGYRSARVVVTPDSVDLLFPGTPIGDIRILGSFVDKRGRFWMRESVLPFRTEVLRAQASVTSDGSRILKRDVGFTYWKGE